ncbi:tetratricopeptide repeat protein [Desulfatibacillum aliphaticivorans]|uniref:tetratricopeptide repeat protein n=1 Tax=Desulfatibacillum aliphaticivorans TaxID=218208 RepID=UPI00041730BC|nr:tetratricopeptide repeat protein [Desulfatibacillum aliphaticivorans]
MQKAVNNNSSTTRTYNDLAWAYATYPGDDVRDGAKAVEYAEKAVNLDRHAIYLDTLAAAYAEAGNFEKAVAAQEEAIAISTDIPKEEKLGLYQRLDNYKQNQPLREY